MTIDASPFVSSGDTNAISAITTNGDCLVYITQVFAIETGGSCGGRWVKL